MAEYWTNGMATLYQADARAIPLPDKSVHMCVTSPPYWGLRDYGLGQWQGGDAECGHQTERYSREWIDNKNGKVYPGKLETVSASNGVCPHCGAVNTPAGIGLEPTLGEWVANVVAVMREVRRVLRDDGTCWLNLGDAYCNTNPRGHYGDQGDLSTGSHGENIKRNLTGLPGPKNLMGQPWRVAFALQDDGWILRSAIVWHKPNPMPESVTDRPTNAYEMLFLLAKQGRYFYDMESVREDQSPLTLQANPQGFQRAAQPKASTAETGTVRSNTSFTNSTLSAVVPGGRNARNVWTIPTQGRPDAHFATFPNELPRRCILAGTSERGVCADCGAPWVRQTEKEYKGGHHIKQTERVITGEAGSRGSNWSRSGMQADGGYQTQTLGWQPTCGCNADCQPATVLDPFAGSGTTLAVAQSLGRKSIGLDLNPEYLEIAKRYINRADGITLSLGL